MYRRLEDAAEGRGYGDRVKSRDIVFFLSRSSGDLGPEICAIKTLLRLSMQRAPYKRKRLLPASACSSSTRQIAGYSLEGNLPDFLAPLGMLQQLYSTLPESKF